MGLTAVPFCDLKAAHAFRGTATEAALLRVARSGRYVLGEEVEAFEREFAAASAARHAVGVGSGTDAIALILRASGVGVGDEVIVPAYTAAATWMAVAHTGAAPVGVDVDPATGLIDPAACAAAVGARTAAMIAVHLFGALAPMGPLRELAARARILLVEDAAHAAVVDAGDGPAGSLGDAAAFSFYPTKTLGGLGDGGAVVTNSEELAAQIRRLRSYGWSQWQGQAVTPGFNSRLDELQAAVLRERLGELPALQARLRTLAGVYRDALRHAARVTAPVSRAAEEPPWHQFVVQHPDRDGFRQALADDGVGTALHYDPIPPGLWAFGVKDRFPDAAAMSARAVSLPFDGWLSDAQVAIVCESLQRAAASSEGSLT